MSRIKNPKKESDGFFDLVYQVVKLIPYGRVTSYGAIARYLGTARSARMVGWALNQSHHDKEFIPAHRVVNRNGLLSGKHHFDGQNVMKQLLESEGIKIEDDQILNFRQLFWDPVKELEL
jgi:methylated-DNA-protein-cysteine methyltransferase related protein